ncbi:MAG: transposase [Bacteroidia bacterium]
MSRNYKFKNPEGMYFVSFATVHWIDVFVRKNYFDSIVKNLNHCVDKKGMEIYAWCIMPSHIHLVFKSTIQNPEDLLRDFKSFSSKEMVKLIENNIQESRREWMLNAFAKAGKKNSNNTHNQFWQQHNKPIELWSNEVIDQKINYIHHNPVEAGFVENEWEYLYSSARDYAGNKGLVKILMV